MNQQKLEKNGRLRLNLPTQNYNTSYEGGAGRKILVGLINGKTVIVKLIYLYNFLEEHQEMDLPYLN